MRDTIRVALSLLGGGGMLKTRVAGLGLGGGLAPFPLLIKIQKNAKCRVIKLLFFCFTATLDQQTFSQGDYCDHYF